MKIKKGDQVTILIGKDKGKTGKVEKIFSDSRVLVEGVNQFKRHFKSRVRNQKSEIITITKPISAANVALICGKCKKAARAGFVLDKKGEKIRICRRCEGVI